MKIYLCMLGKTFECDDPWEANCSPSNKEEKNNWPHAYVTISRIGSWLFVQVFSRFIRRFEDLESAPWSSVFRLRCGPWCIDATIHNVSWNYRGPEGGAVTDTAANSTSIDRRLSVDSAISPRLRRSIHQPPFLLPQDCLTNYNRTEIHETDTT